MVKVERPAGRMTLTTGVWFARLARVDGGRDDQAFPQLFAARRPDSATIPEPERPRRRSLTCDDYRVKAPS